MKGQYRTLQNIAEHTQHTQSKQHTYIAYKTYITLHCIALH